MRCRHQAYSMTHPGRPLRATSGRSEMAAWVRSKVKTVLKRWSSARYRATRRGMAEELSCLRRHRRTGNIAEVRQPRLCKGKRFNSQIISSMIDFAAVRGGRPASDRVSDRQHLQE